MCKDFGTKGVSKRMDGGIEKAVSDRRQNRTDPNRISAQLRLLLRRNQLVCDRKQRQLQPG